MTYNLKKNLLSGLIIGLRDSSNRKKNMFMLERIDQINKLEKDKDREEEGISILIIGF